MSLGSLFTQLFSRERKVRAAAARRILVENLAQRGEHAFGEVAARTALTSHTGEDGPTLAGELRGVAVTVTLAESADEAQGLMTRFTAKKEVRDGDSTHTRAVTLGPKPSALAGLFKKRAPIGDPELDELFAIEASSLDDARMVLDDRAKRTLLSLPDRMPLFLDYRVGDVVLDVSGVELDPERIVFILEWLVAAASDGPDGPKPYRG